MKRNDPLKYLRSQGCEFVREGGRHYRRSSVPRHTEINDNLARKIYKDLGIKPIK
ncbi:MAG: type II toxin-antitoxin system HicA family toxin [Deltaproteobacteria bacterium]|nr:type II toxin-antitoxin system HicA family toxin [Deltaproteobacteria bacterium]